MSHQLIAENEPAPGAFEYHCTLGAPQCSGVNPAAENVAATGSVTVALTGCSSIARSVTHGGGLTVNVAALLRPSPPLHS